MHELGKGGQTPILIQRSLNGHKMSPLFLIQKRRQSFSPIRLKLTLDSLFNYFNKHVSSIKLSIQIIKCPNLFFPQYITTHNPFYYMSKP